MFTPITARYIAFFVLSFTVVTPQSNFRSLARRVVLAAAGAVWFRALSPVGVIIDVAILPPAALKAAVFTALAALGKVDVMLHAAPPYTE